jgi:hypothetical protein
MLFDNLDDYEAEAGGAEDRLRQLWDAKGVPRERQDEIIADITAKAQPGAWIGPFRIPPPIVAIPDPEHASRLDAERVTLELRTRSTRRLDAGRQPITESPLFGGPAQRELF